VSSDHLERLARDLFGAYGDGDLESAYITNADAGVDRVEGRDNFMSRLPDPAGAELSTAITQIVTIDEERVMAMLEIKAERQGRTLPNLAVLLARTSEGEVVEFWMVDAKPAYSDEFWS
jgi:hypothetical protein